MTNFLRDRRLPILLLVVLASLFILMSVQVRRQEAGAPEGSLMRIASPAVRAVSAVSDSVAGAWSNYVDLRGARQRTASLEEQLTLLRLENQKLEEARMENSRLRTLLELRDALSVESVPANVVGSSTRGISRTLLVNRGTESGIRKNMPVVSAAGIVGRVWSVSPGLAKIQLITDSAAGTAVIVQRTRVQGILLGAGADLCTLEYIFRADDVSKEDLLVTSGLDGIYPKGLAVAEVGEVSGSGRLLRRITAVPRVDFNQLEEVLILRRTDIPVPDGLPNQADALGADPARPAPDQLPPR